MGSCSSHEDKVISSRTMQETEKLITKLKEQIDEKFKDMPEAEGNISFNKGEKYRGEGIKRMKGYKCTLPIDELNKLREEFWNSKGQQKVIWKYLKQACLMDDGILEYSF
jgi:hypothetical protein